MPVLRLQVTVTSARGFGEGATIAAVMFGKRVGRNKRELQVESTSGVYPQVKPKPKPKPLEPLELEQTTLAGVGAGVGAGLSG